ncbi:MAG TPA: hypothetical protein VEL05_12645 [Candidatus Acidoferrum sp.]|nr:hypothetical protein [Candidatus Acidoferrum sp.]
MGTLGFPDALVGPGRLVFVNASSPERAMDVQAAVLHGAEQPGSRLKRSHLAPPERQQAVLHGLAGQVVAAEPATSHAQEFRDVRVDQGGERVDGPPVAIHLQEGI